MFTRMDAADSKIICRTLLSLILIVMAGVATAEYQLNTLTHRYEHVQICNIRRDEGGYAAYLLGMPFKVKAVQEIAKIISTADGVTIAAGQQHFFLPTRIYIKIDTVLYWLHEWQKQFVTEAMKTKHNLDDYLTTARPYLVMAFTRLKDACLNIGRHINKLELPTL